MSTAPIRLAIFDCDGTLVDSQANICLSMEQAFVSAKLDPPSREAIRRIVGLSLVEAVAGLLPDGDAALHRSMAEEYRLAFTRLRSSGAFAEEPLFDGMADMLVVLSDSGWTLGIATGKSDRGLARILAHHGLTDRFVTLQTADRHPSKPHPSMIETAMAEAGAPPEHSVMIGDTSYDMLMARAAGVRALGVAWGYHLPHELTEAGAHAVAETVATAHSYGGRMSNPDTSARNHWFAIAATRIAGAAGAVFGLFMIAKGHVWWEKALGIAIVLSALYMMAVVPRSLAHKWRTPDA